jgi:hypothetical protein
MLWGKANEWIIPGSNSFYVGGPSSSAKSGGIMSGMRCMFPRSFATGGNRSYPDY